MQVRNSLIVLCGLPASGKTTLAQELQQRLLMFENQDDSKLHLKVATICYDEVEETIRLKKCVNAQETTSLTDHWDVEVWHETRSRVIHYFSCTKKPKKDFHRN
eukprot:TRINITY_DN3296_c0_g2_i4.p1 TRINITY_DN3296_c0_g2~~TRINITY_DN3296_c0_g2_i4.p1  ORF type:complete len:104 (-),score=9.68 TRINITY_DN3296_c0_g2_i4:1086-1397(-)